MKNLRKLNLKSLIKLRFKRNHIKSTFILACSLYKQQEKKFYYLYGINQLMLVIVSG